jgi:predicted RNase H-like nuclease
MTAILGIDAAWTLGQPSGVSVICNAGGSWRVACAAPSYHAFIAASHGEPIDWHAQTFLGSTPDVQALLAAARQIAQVELRIVAVDMPFSKRSIVGRRSADRHISRVFGGAGCSTHSPNSLRPGALGRKLQSDLLLEGFPLATVGSSDSDSPCTIEVYPHPALLELLQREYRVPYKVSRAARYWPHTTPISRMEKLLIEYQCIADSLKAVFGPLPFDLPAASECSSLARLKRYEDTLDSLICAWVGVHFIRGSILGFGDEESTIWVPSGRGRTAVTPASTLPPVAVP